LNCVVTASFYENGANDGTDVGKDGLFSRKLTKKK
jgi:hypothetical protein